MASPDIVKAVSVYLWNLNDYAAESIEFEQSHPDINKEEFKLIEYHAGGAVVVKPCLDIVSRPSSVPDVDLYDALLRSWMQVSTKFKFKPKVSKYFNYKYDPSATLNYLCAKIITRLDIHGELQHLSSELLIRYSNYILTLDQSNNSIINTYITDDVIDSFQSIFNSNLTYSKIHSQSKIEKALELRFEANLYLKHAKFGKAIALYTEAIQLVPSSYILYSNRAAAYTYLNSIDEAIDDLKKSIQLNSKFETSYTRLAYCYLSKGEPLKSYKNYIKALELSSQQLTQYKQKIFQGLTYAENRCIIQGIASKEELESYLEPIKDLYQDLQRQVRGAHSNNNTRTARTNNASQTTAQPNPNRPVPRNAANTTASPAEQDTASSANSANTNSANTNSANTNSTNASSTNASNPNTNTSNTGNLNNANPMSFLNAAASAFAGATSNNGGNSGISNITNFFLGRDGQPVFPGDPRYDELLSQNDATHVTNVSGSGRDALRSIVEELFSQNQTNNNDSDNTGNTSNGETQNTFSDQFRSVFRSFIAQHGTSGNNNNGNNPDESHDDLDPDLDLD